MTDARIGKVINVDGFTLGRWDDISRTFTIESFINDDGFVSDIVTTCGHIIEGSGNRDVRKISSNRRIMTESRVDWESK